MTTATTTTSEYEQLLEASEQLGRYITCYASDLAGHGRELDGQRVVVGGFLNRAPRGHVVHDITGPIPVGACALVPDGLSRDRLVLVAGTIDADELPARILAERVVTLGEAEADGGPDTFLSKLGPNPCPTCGR